MKIDIDVGALPLDVILSAITKPQDVFLSAYEAYLAQGATHSEAQKLADTFLTTVVQTFSEILDNLKID